MVNKIVDTQKQKEVKNKFQLLKNNHQNIKSTSCNTDS